MADRWQRPDSVPARTRVTLLIGAVLAMLLAGGCATIPSSGPVQSVPTPAPPGGGGSACCGLIVEGPQPGWGPQQIVSGFLLASASFAHHHGIAREYLTGSASKAWQPGTKVTILAQTPTVYQPPARMPGQDNRATVVVSWQELATLNGNGEYIASGRGEAARQQIFTLESVRGQWRIDGLPGTGSGKVSHELLLPSVLFRLDYAPRNLYFYGQPDQVLVPDPVFVPVESSDLVTTLVTGLLTSPNGWLENAAVTAFPPGARLRKVQVLPGPPGDKTAIVDIGLPHGTPRSTVQAMAAQLVWTLTSPAYSPPLIQAVKLKINGHAWTRGPSGAVQDLAGYGHYIPRRPQDENLYYVSTNGAVRMFGSQAHSVAVPGQAGTAQLPLNKIAISLDGRYLAGIAGPATTVYTENLAAAGKAHASAVASDLHSRLTGAGFSTPSWDSAGELWVAGRVHGSPGVWVIPAAARGAPVRVTLPFGVGPVTGLRIAPDGVRIALIVGTGAAAHMLLGAIAHSGAGISIIHTVPLAPGLVGLSALTWYDEDHVLAITQPASGTRLWEVPVNGAGPILKSVQPGMASITSDGPQSALYAGMAAGRLENSVGLGEPWRDITAGRDATYPG
ncbi:MAG TPA: LpqB family beta-propeller domain-containing protein [Streptosporangiaceae bacterium]|nr:LpqB family beta-propeller domain-containing protein [Streptosporangiaceae bacterium]